MNAHEFQRRAQLVEPLVRMIGETVHHQRAQGIAEIVSKADGSPVTNCDIEANRTIIDFLQKHFPGEAVVGEESEDKTYPIDSELLWYVDPIDGTRSFIAGGSDYYVMIGLCVGGVPSFGLIYQPEHDILLAGWTGHPTVVTTRSRTHLLRAAPAPWNEDRSLVMKAIPAELRNRLSNEYGTTRAPYRTDMVDMISPLYRHSNGFISYRRTSYWDLCAPAALLGATGYQTASTDTMRPARFNDGALYSPIYYCLPPDTPRDFIDLIVEEKAK
jgi:3'-phosphoadenosine 5'-phosphosulfate (PAPS) 3'-phosphatase